MALLCCNKVFYDTEKKYLLDTIEEQNRILEFGICPHCNNLKAVLTYTKDGETKLKKPNKRKETKSFIDRLLSEQHIELFALKIKYGSKQNMYWKHNLNGLIKDFNGETKGSCLTELKVYS